MADLIERDAVLLDIDEEIDANQEYPEDKLIRKGLRIARKCIENAPAVTRWIPVEDSLPENNEIVWVCLYWEKNAYVRKGYIKNEVWYTADGYRMWIIPKFWMHEYIPEPPEKGDET